MAGFIFLKIEELYLYKILILKTIEPKQLQNETKEEILESLMKLEEDIKNGRVHDYQTVMEEARNRLQKYRDEKQKKTPQSDFAESILNELKFLSQNSYGILQHFVQSILTIFGFYVYCACSVKMQTGYITKLYSIETSKFNAIIQC